MWPVELHGDAWIEHNVALRIARGEEEEEFSYFVELKALLC